MTAIDVRCQSRKSKHGSGERYIGPVEYSVLKVICHLNGLYNSKKFFKNTFGVVWRQNIHCHQVIGSFCIWEQGAQLFGLCFIGVSNNSCAQCSLKQRPKGMLSGQAAHPKHQNDPFPPPPSRLPELHLQPAEELEKQRLPLWRAGANGFPKGQWSCVLPSQLTASSPASQQLLWISLCALGLLFLSTLSPSGEAPELAQPCQPSHLYHWLQHSGILPFIRRTRPTNNSTQQTQWCFHQGNSPPLAVLAVLNRWINQGWIWLLTYPPLSLSCFLRHLYSPLGLVSISFLP